jgi:hypothetical protein
MKTPYYDIDLMVPMQINKDIIFNEAITKIDNFLHFTVKDFILNLPQEQEVGTKYILSDGEYKNHIAYCTDNIKSWKYIKPAHGMVIFILSDKSFYLFSNAWQKIYYHNDNNQVEDNQKFCGIQNNFVIPNDVSYLYLYMNGNVTLDISQNKQKTITLMIKQNYQQLYKIEWSSKVIWPNKQQYQITQVINRIDIIRLHKIPEIDYFIGEIVGLGYEL